MKEKEAQLLFAELQQLSPSDVCQREFRSFWCLLLFGVCDVSDQKRLPSYDQCIHLQQHCDQEFRDGLKTIAIYLQECNLTNTSSAPPCGKAFHVLK